MPGTEYVFLAASGCVSFVVADASAEFATAPLFAAGDAQPFAMPTATIAITQIENLTAMPLNPGKLSE